MRLRKGLLEAILRLRLLGAFCASVRGLRVSGQVFVWQKQGMGCDKARSAGRFETGGRVRAFAFALLGCLPTGCCRGHLGSLCVTLRGALKVCGVQGGGGQGEGEREGRSKHTARPGYCKRRNSFLHSWRFGYERRRMRLGRQPGLPYGQLQCCLFGNAVRENGDSRIDKVYQHRGEVVKRHAQASNSRGPPFVDIRLEPFPLHSSRSPFEIAAKRQTFDPCPKLECTSQTGSPSRTSLAFVLFSNLSHPITQSNSRTSTCCSPTK